MTQVSSPFSSIHRGIESYWASVPLQGRGNPISCRSQASVTGSSVFPLRGGTFPWDSQYQGICQQQRARTQGAGGQGRKVSRVSAWFLCSTSAGVDLRDPSLPCSLGILPTSPHRMHRQWQQLHPCLQVTTKTTFCGYSYLDHWPLVNK